LAWPALDRASSANAMPIGVYAAPLQMPSGEPTLVLDGRAVLW
jgi:hypothetical protein